jgi:hypothetical protein
MHTRAIEQLTSIPSAQLEIRRTRQRTAHSALFVLVVKGAMMNTRSQLWLFALVCYFLLVARGFIDA